MKRGKNYKVTLEELREKEMYSLDEALPLLINSSKVKFDASCEVHLNLNVNPKQADQTVRYTVNMPNGTGKDLKVVAFVPDDKAKACLDAGALKAGETDLVEEVSKGFTGFDIAVASPDMMKSLGKVAKVLGKKGLMPNPKAGTVTPDVEKTIKEIKKGKIEVKNDKLGNVHNIFGKVSFGEEKLMENLKAYLKSITDNKPTGVKGTFIKSIHLCTSMGPSIKLDPNQVMANL